MTTQIRYTAPILLPSDPSSALQAATKQYVDNNYVPQTTTVSSGTGLTGGGALSANQTFSANFGTTSGTICQGNDSRVTGAAPLASPTFTGTVTVPKLVHTPVSLTDGTTISVDASLGNTFRLTLTATGHTMGNPSNSTDGQLILFEITSGGAFTFAWSTNYVWGSDISAAPGLSQTSGKVDYVGFIYNSTAGKWRGISYARGY